eukprot:TRINITY_DN1292_c0_g1_i1.p1 TRINITY_DN1292_c0_g1~~TRINITY_DN1292_c0_g1_i1.p1  ORF type:complete len:486 (+),score=118.71 TRINITY_DN1292_c0_g1_i1:227-1684(+)
MWSSKVVTTEPVLDVSAAVLPHGEDGSPVHSCYFARPTDSYHWYKTYEDLVDQCEEDMIRLEDVVTSEVSRDYILQLIDAAITAREQVEKLQLVRDTSGTSSSPEKERKHAVFSVGVHPFIRKGKVTSVMMVWRDVTKRMFLFEQLQEEAYLMHAMVSSMKDLVFCFDKEGMFLPFFGNAQGDLGDPSMSFVGEHYSKALPPPVSEQLGETFTELESGASTSRFEYIFPTPEFGPQWYEAVVSKVSVPTRMAGLPSNLRQPPPIPYFVGTCRNINGRKDLEQKLLEREERLQKIVQHMQDGVFTIDGDGFVDYVGPSAHRYLYDQEKIVGVDDIGSLKLRPLDLFKIRHSILGDEKVGDLFSFSPIRRLSGGDDEVSPTPTGSSGSSEASSKNGDFVCQGELKAITSSSGFIPFTLVGVRFVEGSGGGLFLMRDQSEKRARLELLYRLTKEDSEARQMKLQRFLKKRAQTPDSVPKWSEFEKQED